MATKKTPLGDTCSVRLAELRMRIQNRWTELETYNRAAHAQLKETQNALFAERKAKYDLQVRYDALRVENAKLRRQLAELRVKTFIPRVDGPEQKRQRVELVCTETLCDCPD